MAIRFGDLELRPDSQAPIRPGLAFATALLVRILSLVALGAVAGLVIFYIPGMLKSVAGEWAGMGVGFALLVVLTVMFGWRKTLEGLNLAARDTVQLVAVCACAGIIVGVVALTGIGGRFSELILGIAGTSQLIAMIFAAGVALILGMGMPTTAAYAIAAAAWRRWWPICSSFTLR